MKSFRCRIALIASTSIFAQNVPPPPRPASAPDKGPSLAETTKFIQEKLAGQGPVKFVEYAHDNTKGNDSTLPMSYEIGNVRTSADGCRIDYRISGSNGQMNRSLDLSLSIKTVSEIAVMPMDQRQKQVDTRAGHPEYTARVDPAVFALVAKKADESAIAFYFYDESLANRVTKALVHAVELCGGGSEPF